MSAAVPSSPEERRAREERAFARELHDLCVRHGYPVAGQALEDHLGYPRPKVSESLTVEDGKPLSRYFRAAWLRLLPRPVLEAWLRLRAGELGMELRPVTSCEEEPHDLVHVVRELSDVLRASAETDRSSTRAARSEERREIDEAMRALAARRNHLDALDEVERELSGRPAPLRAAERGQR